MKKFIFLFFAAFVLGIILIASPQIFASGFFLYHQDAKAHGQGGAFTAQADNPSAVYYNPAGISQLDGTQISLGTEIIRLESQYKNLSGVEEDMHAKWQAVPSTFITTDMGTKKWTAGLGVYAPFGLSTSWNKTGFLRYIATNSDFNMVDVNPVVAYQFTPEFSAAVGADYYNLYSVQSELRKNFVIGDANAKIDMDGDAWGFNAGCLWKPTPRQSIGLSYRSSVNVKLKGDFTINNIPAGLGYPSSFSYKTSMDMRLPSVVNAGYAFKPIEKLKLEFDTYWVEWSTRDRETLKDRSTGLPLAVNYLDWNDTWIVALGGEYMLKPNLALRAGYSYQENAVPEKTFNPDVPDSGLNVITLGLGYTADRFTVDIAYGIGIYNDRDVRNSVGASVGSTVNGEYKSLIHYIGMTVGVKF